MLRVVAPDDARQEFALTLDEICRRGAERMLALVLEAGACRSGEPARRARARGIIQLPGSPLELVSCGWVIVENPESLFQQPIRLCPLGALREQPCGRLKQTFDRESSPPAITAASSGFERESAGGTPWGHFLSAPRIHFSAPRIHFSVSEPSAGPDGVERTINVHP